MHVNYSNSAKEKKLDWDDNKFDRGMFPPNQNQNALSFKTTE